MTSLAVRVSLCDVVLIPLQLRVVGCLTANRDIYVRFKGTQEIA